MHSVLVLLILLGMKMIEQERKKDMSYLFVGCIMAINTDQCYFCTNIRKNGCGDSFDDNLMDRHDKIDLQPSGVCTVCFLRTVSKY